MNLIPNQRELFEIPDDVAYLRCAATSPALRRARQAGERAIALKSQPWGSAWGQVSAETVEQARGLFAGLIGATADDIALVPSASYGLSTAAANLRIGRGRHVVVLADQFPSNIYPWRHAVGRDGGEMRTVELPGGGRTDAVVAAIDTDTAVVAVPQCHWLDGAMLDLAAVATRCRDVGAALVLDLSQSLGVMPFDARAIDPDFAVTVAEKWLLGPVQLAFLYVAPRQQSGTPIEHGWVGRGGAGNARYLHHYSDAYRAGARRFDVGERTNIVNLAMAIEGLTQIKSWGPHMIARSISPLTQEIANRVESLSYVAIGGQERAPHICGFRHPHGWAADAQQRLESFDVLVSLRGEVLRVAPHLYNGERDIDALVDALRDPTSLSY